MSGSEASRGAFTRRPSRGVVLSLVVVLVAAAAAYVAVFSAHGGAETSELAHALAHRGRVLSIGRAPLLASVDGVEFVDAARRPDIGSLVRATDSREVLEALVRVRASALLIEVVSGRRESAASVVGRLARYRSVPGLRVLHLSPEFVLAVPSPQPRLSDAERDALARVARQILAGSQPPRLSQFPSALRAPYPSEVLLLLRRPSGELALWRSARASSLASGLLTAVGVAKQRWEARTAALGGTLDDELPRFDVEVALLVDDGTLGSRERGFIDRAIGPEHGVAYDDPSIWRYLLPESDERMRARSGSEAFRALFRDNQLREDAFDRADLRLYRVTVQPLSVSRATRR